MNVLELKYSNKIKNNESLSKVTSDEIIALFKNKFQITDSDNNKYRSLESEVTNILDSMETNILIRVNNLTDTLHLIKLKIEKLQKENFELILIKDKQSKQFENEKLKNIITERRVKDYVEENDQLKEKIEQFEFQINNLNSNLELQFKKGKEEINYYNPYINIVQNNSKNLKEEQEAFLNEISKLKSTIEEEKIKVLELGQTNKYYEEANYELKFNFNNFLSQKNRDEDSIRSLINENKYLSQNFKKLLEVKSSEENLLTNKNNENKSLFDQLDYCKDKIEKLEKRTESDRIIIENKNNIIENLTGRLGPYQNEDTKKETDKTMFNKINQLTEQNNFLLVRVNNLTSNNNLLLKDKENLLTKIQNLNKEPEISLNLNQCMCNTIIENLERTKLSLISEIQSLNKENYMLRIEIDNSKNEATKKYETNEMMIEYELSENTKQKIDTDCEVYKNYVHLKNICSDKDSLILQLEEYNNTYIKEINKLNYIINQKAEEVNSLSNERIKNNADLSQARIHSNNLEFKYIDYGFENNQLKSNIQIFKNEIKLQDFSIEKLQIMLNNKDEVIRNYEVKLTESKCKILEFQESIRLKDEENKKVNKKIKTLEQEKITMSSLLSKYKPKKFNTQIYK